MIRYFILLLLSLILVLFAALPLFSFPHSEQTAKVVALVPTEPKPKPEPEQGIQAAAYLLAYRSPTKEETILIEKNSHTPWPLASVSKLFTAIAAKQLGRLDQPFAVSSSTLEKIPDPAVWQVGEAFLVGDLIKSMLVESSNQAAEFVADAYPPGELVAQMDKLASELGLTNTSLHNPNGLDYPNPSDLNQSTANDLLKFTNYLLDEESDILALTRLKGGMLYQASGQAHHYFATTNNFLSDSVWAGKIIGGKTGQTPLAKKNLLLITKAPDDQGLLIGIILGAEDNFGEMKKLLNKFS